MNCAGQAVLAALLVLALAARAHGAEEGAQAPACPGAVARGKAHPQESDRALAERDAARTLTDPRLRAELDERFATDQKARIAWLESRRSRSTGRAVALTDADNVQWLAALVRTHGFPTAAQVGERGVRDAWLLLQHADRAPDFQALLPVLERRYADGDLGASDLARFTDRVLKAQGKPQRYGTQFTPEEWDTGHFGLPDEQSVREIDAHRRELGVMPLADYVCMMRHARKGRP